jgi:hypothetical protein
LQRTVVLAVVRSLYQDGDLKDDDIRDEEKLREKLKEFLEKIDFIPVIDYIWSLLKNARRFKLAEDEKRDCIWYFESLLLPRKIIHHNLGAFGFIALSNAFAPCTFSLRRYTLSPHDTYIVSKLAPPKHRLDAWPVGTGKIAFTRPI